jgi:hypothetical protein
LKTNLSNKGNLEVLVMRRSYLAGAAVGVASLVIGVGASFAASNHPHKKAPKPRTVLLSCTSSPTTDPPAGQPNVDQPPTAGTQYGPADCTSAGFGRAVIETKFTVPDSGNMVGTYEELFDAGTIKGTFNMAPTNNDNPIGSDTFDSQSFTGKITVTGGTGVYKGVKGKNSKGTMSCNSPDSVHNNCTSHVAVLIPPPPATTGSGTGS